MKKMSTSKPKRTSLYYPTVTKIAAIAILISLGLALAGSIFQVATYRFGSYGVFTFRYIVSFIRYILGDLFMIGGGFAVGLLLTRRSRLAKRERVTWAGALGLTVISTNALLFTGESGILWHAVRLLPSVVLLLTPLITLIAIGAVAVVAHHAKQGGRRLLMASFLAAFWLNQVAIGVAIIMAITGNVPGASFNVTTPLWLFTVGLVVSPLIAAIVFYAALRPIGRLVRAFYASFFAAAVYYFMEFLFRFSWSPLDSFEGFFTVFSVSVSLLFMIALLAGLVRARRLR